MKQKSRIIVFIIGVLALTLLTAAGCSSMGDIQKNITPSKNPRKFGATYMTMNNPYFTVMNDSIREVVEANGDILITRDPAQSQKRQNEQIQEMIDEGVTAIFVNPVDSRTILPALKACKKAGVLVFNIDTAVDDEEYVTALIESNNYKAGVLCAKDMMEKKENADILLMNHHNIASTNQRVQGFCDTIAGHPEYRIVDQKSTTSEFELSMQVMDETLKEGLEFDVVMGGNDPTALGALAGLQQNHITKPILIYGVDGSPDAKTMISRNSMEGTSAQSPIQIGRIAAELAYDYLQGENIEKQVVVDVTLITKDNLDEYDINGWQ